MSLADKRWYIGFKDDPVSVFYAKWLHTYFTNGFNISLIEEPKGDGNTNCRISLGDTENDNINSEICLPKNRFPFVIFIDRNTLFYRPNFKNFFKKLLTDDEAKKTIKPGDISIAVALLEKFEHEMKNQPEQHSKIEHPVTFAEKKPLPKQGPKTFGKKKSQEPEKIGPSNDIDAMLEAEMKERNKKNQGYQYDDDEME